MSALGFKANMDPLLCTSLPVHDRFPRFTSGVTPADCIEVSMAAKPFQSTYMSTSIGGGLGLQPITVYATCSKHSTVNHSAIPAQLYH